MKQYFATLILAISFAMVGCASPQTLPTGAGVACTTFNALLYGTVTTVYVGIDKTSGDIKITENCSVEIAAKQK